MEQRVTMRDVAIRARVSQRTVSNVVNEYAFVSDATRSRVLQAIEELGYRPNIAAQQLRAGKTGIIALAVPNMAWPYFGEIAHLARARAEERGKTLLILETEGDREYELRVLSGLDSNLIDGVIFSSIEVTDRDLMALRTNLPFVLIGEKIRGVGVPHFEIDGKTASAQVAEHLVERGARSFAILGSMNTAMTSGPGTPRTEGFREYLVGVGMTESVYQRIEVSPWTYDGAYRQTAAWLAENELPDAIFAMNDIMAAGALRALADIGASVPKDVLLVGWDDTDVARFSLPSITTIRPDKESIARQAVDALITLIDTGNKTIEGMVDINVPHTLIPRESTASH